MFVYCFIINGLNKTKKRFILTQICQFLLPIYMKLPPLTSLRFFDTAAKAGSFVKAAQELNVTHSAIADKFVY